MTTKAPQLQRATKHENLKLWSLALTYYQAMRDGIGHQDRDATVAAIAKLQMVIEQGVDLNGPRRTRTGDGTRRESVHPSDRD
jgi:hypothetical protein